MINNILFNAYETFTEFNQTDLGGMFVYPAQIVPVFIPLVLFAIFSIVLMATFFSQKRLSGRGDFLASFAVAGYFTLIVSFIMTMVDNLINVQTVAVCFVVALIGTVLLLISRNR